MITGRTTVGVIGRSPRPGCGVDRVVLVLLAVELGAEAAQDVEHQADDDR